jgi:hypothetical protein
MCSSGSKGSRDIQQLHFYRSGTGDEKRIRLSDDGVEAAS